MFRVEKKSVSSWNNFGENLCSAAVSRLLSLMEQCAWLRCGIILESVRKDLKTRYLLALWCISGLDNICVN